MLDVSVTLSQAARMHRSQVQVQVLTLGFFQVSALHVCYCSSRSPASLYICALGKGWMLFRTCFLMHKRLQRFLHYSTGGFLPAVSCCGGMTVSIAWCMKLSSIPVYPDKACLLAALCTLLVDMASGCYSAMALEALVCFV